MSSVFYWSTYYNETEFYHSTASITITFLILDLSKLFIILHHIVATIETESNIQNSTMTPDTQPLTPLVCPNALVETPIQVDIHLGMQD
jgi:hypothetical protein